MVLEERNAIDLSIEHPANQLSCTNPEEPMLARDGRIQPVERQEDRDDDLSGHRISLPEA